MRIQACTVLCLVILAAGCGGGGGGGGSDPGTSPPPPSGNARLVSATAEKGPFVIGSSVTVNRLDSQARPIASTLTTETEDNLGNFSFSIDPGPVSISVDGFHFNEITGGLAQGRLTLRAIYEVQDTQSQRAHVNILTHLIHLRVEALVQAGSSIPDAVQTAQTELVDQLSPFFGPFSPDNFTNYSVYASDSTSSDGAAYMLAVTASIYQFAINRGGVGGFDSELALILNNLSDDFADGVIDLQWILDGIDAGSVQVDPEQLSANLLAHAASVGFTAEPADAGLFIDTDRDGIVNTNDDDDDNDGIADGVDGAPLNARPTISGELPRYVVAGLRYENFLEATDPDGDTLTVWTIDGGPGEINASVFAPGEDPGTIMPPPAFNGYTIVVGASATSPPGVYPTTITITDGNDFAVYETVLEVVAGADAPLLTSHPPTIGFRGEPYSGRPEATNPRGTSLTWTIENGPDWLSIDPATGELSGTIPLDYRSVLEPFPLPGFSMELQIGYCRSKTLAHYRDSCPVDLIGIGIDDGTIRTVWPVYIDIFDTAEALGPVVDGSPYHDTWIESVFPDGAGGAYLVGSTGGGIDGINGEGNFDAFVKRIDDRQVEQWTRIIGSDGVDQVMSSALGADGALYLLILGAGDWSDLLGEPTEPGATRRIMVRLSSSGETDWVIEIPWEPGEFVHAIPISTDIKLLAARPGGGVRLLMNNELRDILPDGTIVPHASLDISFFTMGVFVAEDGSTVLAGNEGLARLDINGAELWESGIGGPQEPFWEARSVAFDTSGNLVVAGYSGFYEGLGSPWFVAKYGTDGSQIWFNEYSSGGIIYSQQIGPNGLAINSNGDILLAGRLWVDGFPSDTTTGDYDTVVKFDTNGVMQWYRKLWRVDGNQYMSVATNAENEVLIGGGGSAIANLQEPGTTGCCERHLRNARNDFAFLFDGNGGENYYFLKLDAMGTEL
jgi:hypothetical protein